MTFLDQRSTLVRMTTTKNAFWGKFGTGLVGFSCKIGLAKFKMKMSIPSKMNTLVKRTEMFISGYRASLVKDTSYKGLWKVSFTLKEF